MDKRIGMTRAQYDTASKNGAVVKRTPNKSIYPDNFTKKDDRRIYIVEQGYSHV